jgi:hypothetical protein
MRKDMPPLLAPIRASLDRPLLAYRSTVDAAGHPHTAPVWFGVDGDDLIFPTQADRARLKPIRADPKGAVAIGGDLGAGEGDLRIADDDRALRHGVFRRSMSGEQAEGFIAMVDQLPYVTAHYDFAVSRRPLGDRRRCTRISDTFPSWSTASHRCRVFPSILGT